MSLSQGGNVELPLPEGWNTALVVLKGSVTVNGNTVATGPQLVLLGNAGDSLMLEATVDSVMVLLSGEPIDEPIVGYGPFVMNTQDEISQAIADINNGRFGQISP
jgi:redox-sensitive bicupin YhaK (pirin superfamily)